MYDRKIPIKYLCTLIIYIFVVYKVMIPLSLGVSYLVLCLDFKKQQMIEKYRAIYNLNWSADVGDDAWQLADSWVNTRQIHPDDVPQLGLLNRWTICLTVACLLPYPH